MIKKVCYLKLSPYIGLDWTRGTPTGGYEERLSILHWFYQRGWDVIINSPVIGKDQKWIFSSDCKGTKWEFLRHFKYTEYKQPPIDFKVFIEHGPNTLIFIDKKKIPLLMQMNEFIKKYKGKNIYYWQGDGMLPFITQPERLNYGNIPYFNKYSHSYENVFCDKRLIIITRVKPKFYKDFLLKFNGTRYRYYDLYKQNKLSIEYIPTGLDFDLLTGGMRIPKKKIKYPLCYTGNNRKNAGRLNAFKKYYHDEWDEIETHVFGRWADNSNDEYPFIHFHGPVHHSEVYDILNKSCCQIAIGDGIYQRWGWVTPRIPEAIANGCIVLLDRNYADANKMLPKKFHTPSGLDGRGHSQKAILNKFIKEFLWSRKYRLKVLREQQEYIKRYDINRWGKTLTRIFEKYE